MCRELGYSHPNNLLESLSLDELQEWEAFDSLEPVGRLEERMEYMFGMVCAVITNNIAAIFSKKGSNQTTLTPADFIPKWGVFPDEMKKEHPTQSVDEMKQILLAIAKTQNVRHPEGRRRRK